MKKSLGRILGVLIMLLVAGITVCAADAGDIKKNRIFQANCDVELHEQPDAASAVVATLPGGTPVIVKEDAQGDWCKVAYQEQTGYVQIASLGILGSEFTSGTLVASQPVPSDGSAQDQNAQPSDGSVQDQGAQPSDAADADREAQSSDGSAQDQETGTDSGAVQSQGIQTDGQKAAGIDVNALDEEFKVVQEENLQSYEEAEAAAAAEHTSSGKIWGIVIALLVIAIFAVGIVTTLNKGKKKEK